VWRILPLILTFAELLAEKKARLSLGFFFGNLVFTRKLGCETAIANLETVQSRQAVVRATNGIRSGAELS
jgi:hypothetical protein